MTEITTKIRFMRDLPATLLLVLAVTIVGPACAPAVPAVERTPAATTDAGLPLWEMSQGGSTVYLLGSIHLLRPEVYPLDDAFYDAFDEASIVAFELDFDAMVEYVPEMMSRGAFQDGRTLRDVLPADLYADLEEKVTGLGMPMEAVDGMKPWMVGLTLSSVVLQQAGYDAASGIDMHFHARATEAGTEIVGLETMEDQIDVFERLDADAQVAFLRSTVDELDDTVRQIDEATEMWRRGDSEGLAEMFVDSMGEQEELLERLLFQRNRNWIPQIESLLEREDTAIVIVGMGHLVGEESVIDLLRNRGHEVRQLTSSSAVAAGR